MTILDRIQVFVTIFLGIFIEAAPFLLAGALVSGFLEIFLSRETLLRLAPRRPVLAALTGASLGLVFPVCECGVVPVTRRLYQKGLPMPVGIAFLLAAPVINPVVILSTLSAFGWGPILWGRIGFTFLIAFLIGLIFQRATRAETFTPALLQHMQEAETCALPDAVQSSWRARVPHALAAAGDDFLDMARYLVIGSLLAAAMQTIVPQSALLAIGTNPVTSVLAMLLLAFVLSICSTVDAFVALAFVGMFTPASILAFLVFGPMVDIKSTSMFLGVFQRRKVAYLVLLPALMVLLLGVYLNLNSGVLR
ncbi:MAG: permease [Anaerolineae bacterium]